MIGICIKILVIIIIIYTYVETYKIGKIRGQKDYFNFFYNGKGIYKYKHLKWHYIKPTKYKGHRYKNRKESK